MHGLDDWEVAYDNAKRRAGICRFGDRVLGLSAPLTAVHDEADVRDTILHEIAHALVGPRHGHDATWRRVARSIGCTGERCVSPDSPTAPAAWLGTCPRGHTIERHRRARAGDDLRAVLLGVRPRPRLHLDPPRAAGVVLHPNYEAELARRPRGPQHSAAAVGARVRVTVAGEHHGRVARVAGEALDARLDPRGGGGARAAARGRRPRRRSRRGGGFHYVAPVTSPDERAENKDRDAAIELVDAALKSGRIVQADHDMRVDQIKGAQTMQDIDLQVRDLRAPARRPR